MALEGISARLVPSFAPNYSSRGAWHIDLYDTSGLSTTLGVNDPSMVEVQTGTSDPPARVERVPTTWQIVIPVSPSPLAGLPARLTIRNNEDKAVFDTTWTELAANDMAAINSARGARLEGVQVAPCLPKTCPQILTRDVPGSAISERLLHPAGMVCPAKSWLSVANFAVPYSPMNSLVFKTGCP